MVYYDRFKLENKYEDEAREYAKLLLPIIRVGEWGFT